MMDVPRRKKRITCRDQVVSFTSDFFEARSAIEVDKPIILISELIDLVDEIDKSTQCFDTCSESSGTSRVLDKAEQEEKAMKKKLKKQRQREKKKIEKQPPANTTQTVQDSQNAQAAQTTEATKDSKHAAAAEKCPLDNACGTADEEENDLTGHKESNEAIDDSEDELDFTNNVPVFLKPAIQKSNKLKDMKGCNKVVSENKDSVHQNKTDTVNKNREVEFNDVNDFKFVKGKRQKLLSMSGSKLCGREGVQLILKNCLKEALQVLNMAIEADPTDLRHYLNRGFCYLRLKQYSLVLSDAQHVIKNTDDISLISKAKYQASSAARELQNFEAAEKYLQDSVNLMPQIATYMELLRLRLTQLVNLGFPEDVSLNVLTKCSSTTEAIILLTECGNTSDTSLTEQNAINTNFDKNEIYHSDVEDASMSWLLLNIARSQFNKLYRTELQSKFTSTNASNNGAVKKALPTAKQTRDTKKENKIVNERAVWVGNVTSKMTNRLLQEHFSRFGKVSSVHITQKESLHYAFVNYESAKAASRALAAGTLDVNGTKLVINKAELKIPVAH